MHDCYFACMQRESEFHKLLISKREAAGALSVSLRMIDTLIKRGHLASRLVGRKRLVLVSSLESFIKRDHPLPRDNGIINLRKRAQGAPPRVRRNNVIEAALALSL